MEAELLARISKPSSLIGSKSREKAVNSWEGESNRESMTVEKDMSWNYGAGMPNYEERRNRPLWME